MIVPRSPIRGKLAPMASLAGHFLIASRQLIDPNFCRAVVLILKHDDDGAMGVIINRPLSVTVREVCSQSIDVECQTQEPLYLGGPCDGPLVSLHTSAEIAGQEVIGDVRLTMAVPQMEQLLRDAPQPVRFITNYSGWGIGQLESELEEGSWLTLPASSELLFAPADSLWDKLVIQSTLGKMIDARRIPDDPSMN